MKTYASNKIVIALAFLCMPLLLAPAFAATPAPVSGQQAVDHPSIQVENPNYNFGKAVQGAKIEHQFTVRNVGKKVLRIERVRVS